MLNNGQGYSGFLDLTSFGSSFNAQSFLVMSILSKISTATIVKVVKVTNSGGVSGSGFVDVQPLVNMVDGSGNAFPHGVIYQCAYNRVQGGSSAVILDPVVGDIGLVIFADRDISSAIATRKQANPGSNRMFDMADGIYVFSLVTDAPTQFVEFLANGGGINITSPGNVTINGVVFSPSGSVTAPAGSTITAPNVVGTTNVTFGGKSGIAHVHSGVTTGTSNTGAPV